MSFYLCACVSVEFVNSEIFGWTIKNGLLAILRQFGRRFGVV